MFKYVIYIIIRHIETKPYLTNYFNYKICNQINRKCCNRMMIVEFENEF